MFTSIHMYIQRVSESIYIYIFIYIAFSCVCYMYAAICPFLGGLLYLTLNFGLHCLMVRGSSKGFFPEKLELSNDLFISI